MLGEERRDRILRQLQQHEQLTGQELAAGLGVSRQVIVQDMALLRAEGHPIIATPRGYVYWVKTPGSVRAVFAVHHGAEPSEVQRELVVMVTAGVSVVNVMVAHPLYGELTGALDLKTVDAVERFIAHWSDQRATLLSTLTGGVHLHTVEGSPEAVAAAKTALRREGFLLE